MMNDALFGALMGACVTLIPSVLTQILSSRDKDAQRRHELRLKQYDSFVLPTLKALERYREALGRCMSSKQPNDTAILQEYYSAYEIAYPHVSSDTQQAMSNLDVPIDYDVNDQCIENLNKLLSADIRRILDEACDTARNCSRE